MAKSPFDIQVDRIIGIWNVLQTTPYTQEAEGRAQLAKQSAATADPKLLAELQTIESMLDVIYDGHADQALLSAATRKWISKNADVAAGMLSQAWETFAIAPTTTPAVAKVAIDEVRDDLSKQNAADPAVQNDIYWIAGQAVVLDSFYKGEFDYNAVEKATKKWTKSHSTSGFWKSAFVTAATALTKSAKNAVAGPIVTVFQWGASLVGAVAMIVYHVITMAEIKLKAHKAVSAAKAAAKVAAAKAQATAAQARSAIDQAQAQADAHAAISNIKPNPIQPAPLAPPSGYPYQKRNRTNLVGAAIDVVFQIAAISITAADAGYAVINHTQSFTPSETLASAVIGGAIGGAVAWRAINLIPNKFARVLASSLVIIVGVGVANTDFVGLGNWAKENPTLAPVANGIDSLTSGTLSNITPTHGHVLPAPSSTPAPAVPQPDNSQCQLTVTQYENGKIRNQASKNVADLGDEVFGTSDDLVLVKVPLRSNRDTSVWVNKQALEKARRACPAQQ